MVLAAPVAQLALVAPVLLVVQVVPLAPVAQLALVVPVLLVVQVVLGVPEVPGVRAAQEALG